MVLTVTSVARKIALEGHMQYHLAGSDSLETGERLAKKSKTTD